MSEHASTVLTPQPAAPSPEPRVKKHTASSGREFLFDSITTERIDTENTDASPWSTFFTGLLWVGYSIAIAVAMILVWSAARELLR